MSTPILEVTNISKAYRSYGSEWRRLLSWFGLHFKTLNENWTLHNISFSLSQGDTVGIVGQNGAGKSTLLKIITGTLKPTTGSVRVHGRIAAILELGMGFHPDLTGRQNAYHSAGLMGFTSQQIDAVIDHIEEFAEIGEYFDQPVRIYSSGMQVRVAFAVATAYRPEILIVDEALSVGDTYFQHKSFARIREFKEQGTTLLLVSHDETTIQNICNRAILLDNGTVLQDGNTEDVLNYYKALIAEKETSTIKINRLEDGTVQTLSGGGEARIRSLKLTNDLGVETDTFFVGQKLTMTITVDVYAFLDSLVLGFSIKDRLGQIIYGTNTWHTDQIQSSIEAGTQFNYEVAFEVTLGVGSYSIQLALHDQETHLSRNYEWIDRAAMFNVLNENKNYFIGLSWLKPNIRMEKIG